MMWYWTNGTWGWAGWVMGIIMVLFWAFVIWAIFWGIRKWTYRGYSGGHKTPLDIAKERYAKGEITREQFEEIKKNLNS